MSYKILVADDQKEMGTILRIRLEAAGYKVILAYDCKTAEQKIAEEKPDLIILDVMMPDIGGWELCKKIRGSSEFKNKPVIMFSAAKISDAEKSDEHLADRFFSKPFDLNEFLKAIKELLEKTSNACKP